MAKKYFEQMLLDELAIGRATSFPRWYAAPNPMYYGFCGINQDFRNIARVNRQDLYSVEYNRQPFFVPQTLVFPNYEPVYFLKRNNKRFSSGKNHISKDKRSNIEKKFYRQDDVHNSRGERGKPFDYQSQFERRYQESFNRDGLHYQIPRNDRSGTYLAYRNSNFDMCSENMMMGQHVHNIKQMVESRNPSLECLPVHENLQQTGYRRNENSIQRDSQKSSYGKSDIQWQNQANDISKITDSIQYPHSQNFSNNNESWYCPQEQQQIVDMLKEINLRHDRQLKSDILLSRSEQLSSDELICSMNDSQTSLSSEEDEDNINILLYPSGIPPILEAEEENKEGFKTKEYNATSSDFFEEFQNIFTASPEKKIINEMVKEPSEKSQTLEDDDLENTGRVITDDDKNAVKIVLDFDLLDELIEKTSSNAENTAMSSAIDTSSYALENNYSETTSSMQCSTLNKECDFNSEINNSEMDSDSNSKLNTKNDSSSHSFSEVLEPINESVLASPNTSSKNSGLNKYSNTNNSIKSEVLTLNKSLNADKCANEDVCITPSKNDTDCYEGVRRKIKKDKKKILRDISVGQSGQNTILKETFDNNTSKIKLLEEISKNKYDSSACTIQNYSILSEVKAPISNPSNEDNFQKNVTGVKVMEENSISHVISNKTFSKQEHKKSLSEPFLPSKMSQMEYKRISISEIFSNANTVPKIGCRKAYNYHHLEHLTNLNNVENLSATEHLKLILGIGQNNEYNEAGYQHASNDTTNKATSNKCQDIDKLKTHSMTESYINLLESPQQQISFNSPHCVPNPVSTAKVVAIKDNCSKTSAGVDPSTNCKSAKKNKTLDKNCNKCIDINRCGNIQREIDATKGIQDSTTKSKKKQKNKKGNQRKEVSSDKGIPSIIEFTETNTSQSSYAEPNTYKIPDCNKKFTPNAVIKSHKSFNESKSNNEYLPNENSRKKSKTGNPNINSEYADQKMSIKDNVVSMVVDDSDLTIKSEKDYNEISAMVHSNVGSSNMTRKTMITSYPSYEKSLTKNEAFSGRRYLPLSSFIAKDTRTFYTGMHYRQNYSYCHTANSKYFYRKKYNMHPDVSSQSENYENNKLRIPEYSKTDTSKALKTYKTPNKNSGSGLQFNQPKVAVNNEANNEKLSSEMKPNQVSQKTRRKNKKKRKDKITDKCENESDLGQTDQIVQNSKMSNCSKEMLSNYKECKTTVTAAKSSQPENLMTDKGIPLNYKAKATNLCQNSEVGAKKQHLERSENVDSIACFNNAGTEFNSDKHRPTFNERVTNKKEKNSYLEFQDQRIKTKKTANTSSVDENAQRKANNFPVCTALSKNDKFLPVKKVDDLTRISSNEELGQKNSYLEKKSNEKNAFLEENTLRSTDEKFLKNSKYLKNKNHTEMRKISSKYNSHSLNHDKESEYYNKGHRKQKEYISEQYCSSNETVTKPLVNNELQQKKEQTLYNCKNTEVINGKTNVTACYHGNASVLKNTLQSTLVNIENFASSRKSELSPEKEIRRNNNKEKTDTDEFFLFNLQNANSVNSAIIGEAKKGSFLGNAHTKIMPHNDKSLQNGKIYKEKDIYKMKFGDFLKNFVVNNCQKTRNKTSKTLSSPIFISKSSKMRNSFEPSSTDVTRFPLTVIPEVINTYMRNKAALKMKPLFDLHVHFYLADFFSNFEFSRFNPELEKGIKLSLKSIIEGKLLHVLPLLLNILSSLPVFHLHWNHDCSKKFLKVDDSLKKAKACKGLESCNEQTMSQNCVNEVLKCWYILYSCIDKKKLFAIY